MSFVSARSRGSFSSASANAATHGCDTPWRGGNNSSYDRGRSHDSGRGPSPGGNHGGFNNSTRIAALQDLRLMLHGATIAPQCQVCLKVGHPANVCWCRFNKEFIPHNRMAAMACSSTGNDPN